MNDSYSSSLSSHGKSINLLVIHGTADTTVHPQHSMMLVRGVMQQQQQQHAAAGVGNNAGRRNSNLSAFGSRVSGGYPTRAGAIRLSQLVMPDVDLSNSRMATDLENGSPGDHQHQLLHTIYGHVSRYLVNECFTSVGEGSRGRGVRIRGQRLRKRRRRRWRNRNQDQENLDDQQHQQRGEDRQQHQHSQRSIRDNESSNSAGYDNKGGDRSSGGRYRRHNIDSDQHNSKSRVEDGIVVLKVKSDGNRTHIIGSKNGFVGSLNGYSNDKSNRKNRRRDEDDHNDHDDDDDSDKEYDDDDYEHERDDEDSDDGEEYSNE